METSATSISGYAEWEKAEVERSGVEASITSHQNLAISPRTRARYANPPADTPYPLEYAYHLLGDVTGKDVLDLGCGSGSNTALIALRGATVWALDLSPDLIDLARTRLTQNHIGADVRFVVGSAHAIDLPDRSMDVVFGIAVLHHLDLAQASAEVHRVLKPGGRAIFQEPVRNSRLMWAIRRLIPYRAPDVSPYERPLTDAELVGFGRPFRSMESRAFALPHVALAQVVPAMRGQVDRMYRVDRALLRAAPLLDHFAGIRVVEYRKGF